VQTGLDGELELGADAVGGGDQDRILEAAGLQIEQTAEAANRTKHALALGRFGKGSDRLHQSIAGVDIDARIAIGQPAGLPGGRGHAPPLFMEVQAMWHNNRA
jgi:hypothetical protein